MGSPQEHRVAPRWQLYANQLLHQALPTHAILVSSLPQKMDEKQSTEMAEAI